MKFRANKILGLAIGQKSILLAEVASKSGKPAILHFAEFAFPEGLSLNTPEKLGDALAQFLRTRKLSTRDTVIGLPAKRILTRRKDVPPASPAMAASALRLQAEGDFSAELDNLIMDFAGTTSTTAATSVLLMATNKSVLDQCEIMAKSAGLKLLGVSSTSAALGRATSRFPGGDGLVLNLTTGGAELILQQGQDTTYLRHLNIADSSAPEAIGALAGEIRRTIAGLPLNSAPLTMTLWNSATSIDPARILSERLGMPVSTPEIGKVAATDAPEANEFAPAIALAMAAIEPAGLPVDFLNSRLAIPEDTSKRRQMLVGVALAVVLVGAIVAAFGHVYSLGNQVADLKDQIKQQDGKLKLVKTEAEKLNFAKGWIPTSPHFIACYYHVSNLFPDRGGTIWASTLSNSRDQNTWLLNGKCTNEIEAQALVDRMLNDPHFANPMLNLQEDSQSRLINYSILFTFRNTE